MKDFGKKLGLFLITSLIFSVICSTYSAMATARQLKVETVGTTWSGPAQIIYDDGNPDALTMKVPATFPERMGGAQFGNSLQDGFCMAYVPLNVDEYDKITISGTVRMVAGSDVVLSTATGQSFAGFMIRHPSSGYTSNRYVAEMLMRYDGSEQIVATHTNSSKNRGNRDSDLSTTNFNTAWKTGVEYKMTITYDRYIEKPDGSKVDGKITYELSQGGTTTTFDIDIHSSFKSQVNSDPRLYVGVFANRIEAEFDGISITGVNDGGTTEELWVPEKPEVIIEVNPDTYTNGNVDLTVRPKYVGDTLKQIKKVYMPEIKPDGSIETEVGKEWTAEGFTLNTDLNGKYTFDYEVTADGTEYSFDGSISTDLQWIDKVAPEITFDHKPPTDGDTTKRLLTVTVKDSAAVGRPLDVVSGGLELVTMSGTPLSTPVINGSGNQVEHKMEVGIGQTYSFTFKDLAGNVTTEEFTYTAPVISDPIANVDLSFFSNDLRTSDALGNKKFNLVEKGRLQAKLSFTVGKDFDDPTEFAPGTITINFDSDIASNFKIVGIAGYTTGVSIKSDSLSGKKQSLILESKYLDEGQEPHITLYIDIGSGPVVGNKVKLDVGSINFDIDGVDAEGELFECSFSTDVKRAADAKPLEINIVSPPKIK